MANLSVTYVTNQQLHEKFAKENLLQDAVRSIAQHQRYFIVLYAALFSKSKKASNSFLVDLRQLNV